MKLIVDNEIALPEEYIDVNILREFNIITRQDGLSIAIIPQKICLNEVQMNSLFSECISFGSDITVKYANIGGPGCEMALTIKQQKGEVA